MATLRYDTPASLQTHKRRVRAAITLFYFGQGLAFASWASRIPLIKSQLALSDAQLGTVLLMLPIGQLLTMPLSGKLVSKFGSHSLLPIMALLYGINLLAIAFAANGIQLGILLFLFGVIGNMCNISVNTQGVLGENIYQKPIMASFHGAWSLAGFTGALIGLLTTNLHLSTAQHFLLIFVLLIINVFVNRSYLAPPSENLTMKRSFSFKPDRILISLGVVGFCSMATEGAMFDWSGVYFHDIVQSPEQLVTLGYASFMIMMAIGRFIGDFVLQRLGRQRTLQVSGLLMFTGMMLSVAFPNIYMATVGFMMVGIGVACNIPTVYSVAGKHPTIPSGMAIAMVSTVSYLGFLMGPPLIGYIAEVFSLRFSFALFSFFGLLMFIMSSKLKVFKV
ncbi:MFS transporter [Sphingobacterium sp. SGG-5]|uniref:MFS transporter n=1 Tax=Sphingobacterium sp. SGG-5 TaxID=2710881 RepID=UPI0013EE0A4E|nr:MFS transporter [Sphingobacterium sp. SGG-5]NGM60914.1 MFS transporter [Sphingobacterium sp. SGG-5]